VGRSRCRSCDDHTKKPDHQQQLYCEKLNILGYCTRSSLNAPLGRSPQGRAWSSYRSVIPNSRLPPLYQPGAAAFFTWHSIHHCDLKMTKAHIIIIICFLLFN
jgi:hypothetical protein